MEPDDATAALEDSDEAVELKGEEDRVEMEDMDTGSEKDNDDIDEVAAVPEFLLRPLVEPRLRSYDLATSNRTFACSAKHRL